MGWGTTAVHEVCIFDCAGSGGGGTNHVTWAGNRDRGMGRCRCADRGLCMSIIFHFKWRFLTAPGGLESVQGGRLGTSCFVGAGRWLKLAHLVVPTRSFELLGKSFGFPDGISKGAVEVVTALWPA